MFFILILCLLLEARCENVNISNIQDENGFILRVVETNDTDTSLKTSYLPIFYLPCPPSLIDYYLIECRRWCTFPWDEDDYPWLDVETPCVDCMNKPVPQCLADSVAFIPQLSLHPVSQIQSSNFILSVGSNQTELQ